jgi:putative transcriptional regulator
MIKNILKIRAVDIMRKYAVQKNITGLEIKKCRKRLGVSQEEFAELANVSKKTVERWEYSGQLINGPIVTLIQILMNEPAWEEKLVIPEKEMPIRISYMFRNELCTIIDVDEGKRSVNALNYTNHFLKKAFGDNEHPTYEDYEEFLESRCFPRTRDKMKLILRELDLPFYDPMMIIEKTEGRMAEDDFWIRIER